MGSIISGSVPSFHLSLQWANMAGLLHMGHCARDCGYALLPKETLRNSDLKALWGKLRRGPASAVFKLVLAPSLSSQKAILCDGSTPDLSYGDMALGWAWGVRHSLEFSFPGRAPGWDILSFLTHLF